MYNNGFKVVDCGAKCQFMVTLYSVYVKNNVFLYKKRVFNKLLIGPNKADFLN